MQAKMKCETQTDRGKNADGMEWKHTRGTRRHVMLLNIGKRMRGKGDFILSQEKHQTGRRPFSMYRVCTEGEIKVCTWLQEISSFSCLTVLPGPAWLLLNKICVPLFWALYRDPNNGLYAVP